MRTLVYKYGLLPPTLNKELVSEQMLLAHRYYNLLVEIERKRRAVVDGILSSHSGVAPIESEIEVVDGELQAAIENIKKARNRSRRRSDTKEQRQRVRDLRARLKELRAQRKVARIALREDAGIQRHIKEVNAKSMEESKIARANCGCYWGTYLQIEQALDAARKSGQEPRFRCWGRLEAVAVQLQGGLSWDSVVSCKDRRLQVDMTLRPCGKGKPRPRIRLRVGSDGRDPVWAEWPLILHRPLPDDSKIMWAKVIRERLGGKDRWNLHLTLRIEGDLRRQTEGGMVALDLGWRAVKDGLRVGYVLGSGMLDAGEIILDPGVMSGLKKVDDLQSIRDQHLNEIRPWLSKWLRNRKLPEWLEEDTKTLAQWKSPARFGALAIKWRDSRWARDKEGFEQLEAWRKRDKHLWTWEANQRDKSLRRRREQYRLLGVRLSKKYQTLVIEALDLRTLQRHKSLESEKPEIPPARAGQRLAAPSELRNCLVQAFAKRGGTVIEIPAAYTTVTCHVCGVREEWDTATYQNHTCGSCKTIWDQDYNACRNLLALGRECLGSGKIPVGAHIKDYSDLNVGKESKWGRLGRHKKTARKKQRTGVK